MIRFILLLPCLAWSTQLEVSGSMLTMHYLDSKEVSQNYSNKVGMEGRLISNPILSVGVQIRDKDLYRTHNFLVGVDSIASPIAGYLHTFGMYLSQNFRLGAALGGYTTVNENWKDRGIVMPHTMRLTHGYSLVPIVGVEASLRFEVDRGIYLGLTNVITPIISNHAVTFSFNI